MSRSRELVPIFPLENVVLFPRVVTPLHLFEPRYRQMAADALAGERRIAMFAIAPGQVEAMADDPEVYPVGCVGTITQSQKLPDGRYNIVLIGTHRVRLVGEPERPREQLYRVGEVERLEDAFESADAERVAVMRDRVIELVASLARDASTGEGQEVTPEMFEGVDDAALVNSLANGFPFQAPEKQGLLEADSIPERFEQLEGLLEFLRVRRFTPGTPNSGTLH